MCQSLWGATKRMHTELSLAHVFIWPETGQILLFVVKELSGAMSKPTLTSLQRLRKLVGYLKLTAEVCVVLDAPEPGQGKWKNSDKFWVLESFSDSYWSSNQTHRRSTSCGIHMLNGVYLFGSSKSQRVVSLSSCEAELHALVSTFCDGIFLRRCLQFLTGAVIDHFLFTDSSSARQLAMRQGTEKVKHLSGKILLGAAVGYGRENCAHSDPYTLESGRSGNKIFRRTAHQTFAT